LVINQAFTAALRLKQVQRNNRSVKASDGLENDESKSRTRDHTNR